MIDNKYILYIEATDRKSIILIVKYHKNFRFTIKKGKIILDGLKDNIIAFNNIESINNKEIIKPKSFDIIICNDLLNVCDNFSDLLLQLKNLLKPDGYLIITYSDISEIIFCIKDIMSYVPEVFQKNNSLIDWKTFHLDELFDEISSCGYEIRKVNRIETRDDNNHINCNLSSVYPDLSIFFHNLFRTSIKYYFITVFPEIMPKKIDFKPPDINTHFLQIVEKSKLELRYAFAELLENYQKIELDLNQKSSHIYHLGQLLKITEDKLKITEDKLKITEDKLKITEDELKNTYFTIRFSEKMIALLESTIPECSVRLKVINELYNIENIYYTLGFIKLMAHYKVKIIRMIKNNNSAS